MCQKWTTNLLKQTKCFPKAWRSRREDGLHKQRACCQSRDNCYEIGGCGLRDANGDQQKIGREQGMLRCQPKVSQGLLHCFQCRSVRYTSVSDTRRMVNWRERSGQNLYHSSCCPITLSNRSRFHRKFFYASPKVFRKSQTYQCGRPLHQRLKGTLFFYNKKLN